VDLRLDGNEGSRPDAALFDALVPDPAVLRSYPDAGPLEARIAARFDVDPDRVIVTSGADEVLDRLCRAFLAPGRRAVLPTPGFEMLDRYAALAGAEVVAPRWLGGPYPLAEALAVESPSLIAVTSPNNPTGGIASTEDILRLADARPNCLVLLDAAYVEFADVDPTAAVLGRPNVVVVRTLSKAWGLAGLRVGFAIAAPDVVRALRCAGSPYPVGALSLTLAAARLETGEASMRAFVDRVRDERGRLAVALTAAGLDVVPSQANFVFAQIDDPEAFCLALARCGIAIRRFPTRPGLERAIRIACPGDERSFTRLIAAVEAYR
jgi:histidinol-phosphate aminotransferase